VIRPLLAAAALLLTATAHATPSGRVLRYRGAGQGAVVFDPRVHAKAGLVCKDCHGALFPTRRTGLVSQGDHEDGTRCFACHDGRRAFSDCRRCHAGA